MLKLRVVLPLCLALTGCAQAPSSPPATTAAPLHPKQLAAATSPAAEDPNALLMLDQIEPRPKLQAARPATEPSEPPLGAVRLFAQARVAQLDGQRLLASRLLEEAVALDPESFELHNSLGDLYAAASDTRATEQWERAAAIEPDHLDVQVKLGRQAIEEGDAAKGLEHLRLALQTRGYRDDDPAAGEADFLLAKALQDGGYDRAALQMYERLLGRLNNPRLAVRVNPQLASLMNHPDALALHIAALYEKNHSYGAALTLLRAVASHSPGSFELRERLIRDTAATGNRAQAVHDAAELVARFHANRKSLALLREITQGDIVEVLEQVREQNPNDRDIVYALADVLRGQSRFADAGLVLQDAERRWPDDPRGLRCAAELLRAQNEIPKAARQIVLALARNPNRELEFTPVWDEISLPSAHGQLRLADVQAMKVPAWVEASRLLLLARSAQARHRDSVERDALRRATEIRPVFAPAWREALALIWADEGRTRPEKEAASRELEGAAAADHGGLAEELRGQALLDGGDADGAATQFAAAVRAGNRSAALYLNFAVALHVAGDDAGAESLLWRAAGDQPLAREAYAELYSLFEKRNEEEKAARVLSEWLSADPDGTLAPRLQARAAFARRRFTEAERILLELFDRHDSDPQVLGAVAQFYAETGRLPELVAAWTPRLAAEPWNSSLAIALAEALEQQHQHADALRVLDALRDRSAGDADLLYSLAGLYARLSEKGRSEQALTDVLGLDPSCAGASNDLGYAWADEGKNLGQAETLVRKAVQQEPDNLSFLDSMGWVLYKRGKYEEALRELTRAALLADPVVLDHLGDTLYRLGDRARAVVQWRQAAQRIADLHEEDRDDLKRLGEQLLRKQREFDAGEPVGVAPVADEAMKTGAVR